MLVCDRANGTPNETRRALEADYGAYREPVLF
jgi:hypothetical protein